MKKIGLFLIVMMLSTMGWAQSAGTRHPNLTYQPENRPTFVPNGERQMLLAPTTWGFFGQYTSYSVTGSYTFRVSSTSGGVNYIRGGEWNQTSYWPSFVNQERALYVFDLSTVGAIVSARFTMQATSENSPLTLTFFDAEDFGLENAAPWAIPTTAFNPGPTAIGTAALSGGLVTDNVSVDVSPAATADVGGYSGFLIDVADPAIGDYEYVYFYDANLLLEDVSVPTLGVWGLIAFCGFLLAGGVWFMIRRRA